MDLYWQHSYGDEKVGQKKLIYVNDDDDDDDGDQEDGKEGESECSLS